MKNLLTISAITMSFLLGCTSNRTLVQQEANNNMYADSLQTTEIANKYWKLVMLDGKMITMVPNQEREAYFTLKTDQKMINGFAGCNSFTGNYTQENGGRIRFSQMATTMKACPDVNINEGDYLKVFELADNYTIHNDTLFLNVGRRAPLATFAEVYLQ
ncbi:MAG: META domain-containing protein [Ginsengibacter sp.]